jgi:1-acyl-sn-glycerol-3-phosphate acyltransferase
MHPGGVIILVLVVCATLVSVLGTLGMRPAEYDSPLPFWRAYLLAPLRPLMRAALLVSGIWVTVRGHPAPKAAAPILVCNHRCFLEPMFLIATLGGSAVAAAENAGRPLVGSVLIALQNILV